MPVCAIAALQRFDVFVFVRGIIDVGSRSTFFLGGEDIFARKILSEKFTKYPNFHDFCPKNARILHTNCPKNIFFPNLRGSRALPAPISYAYERDGQ